MIVMSIRIVCFFLFILNVSCQAAVNRPHATYQAELEDYAKIEQIETLIRAIAANRNLDVFEKDRDEMSYLTQGEPAFFIALYYMNEPVMTLTNVGIGNKLTLTTTDYGDMSLRELEKLTQQILSELETLTLVFRKVN